MKLNAALVILCSTFLAGMVSAQHWNEGHGNEGEQCGWQADNALCRDNLCCSKFGFCGSTDPWCGDGCQSFCNNDVRDDHRCNRNLGNAECGKGRCCSIWGWCGSGPQYCSSTNDVTNILSESVFNTMFSHRNDCPSQDFYTYHAFLSAAESFPSFATTGDVSVQKRELAAFLALVSQATTGKWSDVEDPHGWGLCHINSTASAHNMNYGLVGRAIGVDPEMVAADAVVSFKTALRSWMTQHKNKASGHDVVVHAKSTAVTSSGVVGNGAGYYKRYCDMLRVTYGKEYKYWFPHGEFAGIQLAVEA